MTNVELVYENNIVIGFRMKGHAMLNTQGPDVLCAALSTASQMTTNGIIDWTGLDVEDIVQELGKEAGLLTVIVPPEHSESCVVQQLFKSFDMYICQLAEQYPNNVRLERRQWNDYKVD